MPTRYGLRNVNDRAKALSELFRVLKPGASAAILDFNNSTDPTVDNVQGWFLEVSVVAGGDHWCLGECVVSLHACIITQLSPTLASELGSACRTSVWTC